MKHIKIFLSDKLITCDSIVPVCLEIKARYPNYRFDFYFNSQKQYEVIKQNETLKNALLKIDAKLHIFGSFKNFYYFELNRKLVIIVQLSLLVIQMLFLKTYFFHFKKLSFFPFSLLRILNPSRTFYFQSNAWGVPQKLREIDDLIGNRSQLPTPPAEKIFVGYNDNWINSHKSAVAANFYQIEHPRLLASWKEFLGEQKRKHSHLLCQERHSRKVFSIILGYFGKLDLVKDDKSMERCFIETLKSIFKVCPDAKVYLKPHIITDIDKLRSLLVPFEDFDIEITYIHPALVAHFSDAVICNAYSSAMPDAFFEDTVTIEYSEYGPKALDLSSNQSVEPNYIDHFFNKNPTDFRKLLRQICNGKDTKKKKRGSKNSNNINQENFFALFL